MVDVRISLMYRALVALDHEIETCGAEPSKPGPAVRFALAFLYCVREGQKREPYDGFWKELVAVDGTSWEDEHKRYRRRTQLTGSLHAIARSLQLPTTPGIFGCISRGRQAGFVRQAHVDSFWEEIHSYHTRGIPARRKGGR